MDSSSVLLLLLVYLWKLLPTYTCLVASLKNTQWLPYKCNTYIFSCKLPKFFQPPHWLIVLQHCKTPCCIAIHLQSPPPLQQQDTPSCTVILYSAVYNSLQYQFLLAEICYAGYSSASVPRVPWCFPYTAYGSTGTWYFSTYGTWYFLYAAYSSKAPPLTRFTQG